MTNHDTTKRRDLASIFKSAASEWDNIADAFKREGDGIRAGEFRDKAEECEKIANLLDL